MLTFCRKSIGVVACSAVMLLSSAASSFADDGERWGERWGDRSGGEIIQGQPATPMQGEGLLEFRPPSSMEQSGTRGYSARTHLRILLPPDGSAPVPVSGAEAKAARAFGSSRRQSSVTYVENTPSSFACVYGLIAQPLGQPAGCNPGDTTVSPSGGGGAIALVDAYDDPTAATDIAYFSKFFDLQTPSFQIVYAGGAAPYITGSKPQSGLTSGWNIEASLDIEWAHAMAPGAKIFLIEAQDSSFSSLLTAIEAAEYLVSVNGGGEVSMSWGDTEFSSETIYDSVFTFGPANVAYFAAAGDSGGKVTWPAASPDVVGVGGTSIESNSSGNFLAEVSWTSGGGGVSAFEQRPSFQSTAALEKIVGSARGTPDVALDANPSSGVAVYVSAQWYIVGGTSVAAPSTAGIVNVASNGVFTSSATLLAKLYANGKTAADFRDIVSGTCGTSETTAAGFDLCTGWGSSTTYAGK